MVQVLEPGVDLRGSTRSAKDDGKAGTPCLQMLLQSEGTYDILIISWFGDVYMLEINILFAKEMGAETPRLFDPMPVIDNTATV